MLLPRMRYSLAAGRPRALVRSAAIAAAALLVAGPLAGSAHAEPAKPELPAELIAAITRDLKISPQDYLSRADTAQKLAAFATTAQRQFPAVFAGSWLDEAGKAVVALAQGEDLDGARKAAQDAGFTVKDVAKSESTLRSEKNAFQKWLEGQPAAVSKSVRGVAIDTMNNTLAVRVDQAGLALPGFMSPARVIVMAAPPTAGEDIAQAGAIAGAGSGPLAAGDGYASVSGRMSLKCSLGFNGVDRNNYLVNITAGHCNPNIAATGGANSPGVYEMVGDRMGNQMGAFDKSVLGNQDYSLIAINGEYKDRFVNNLVRVPNAAPVGLTGVAVPVVGAPVCKSGARTGFSCGVVNAIDQTVQVGDRLLTQSFSANICALPGDSGGPIITGTQALGISSASSVADYPICEIPNLIGLLTGDTPQLFAQPLTTVLSDNPGLRVLTN
ncbi:S1 family peptidase [Nocardia inohanensis]|uniref:S1 family peptidase n=1 Tax=Nocardia inohanensis TaxID=209246 RepID=UPI000B13B0D4|nr:S1 family peptidase [Nocardia inohanensis]